MENSSADRSSAEASRSDGVAAPGRGVVAAGVAGALLIAGSAPLVALSGTEPGTSAFFRCLYALPFLVALALRERRRDHAMTTRGRVTALAAGACFTADLLLWHTAIDLVGAGLATVLANVQVVVTGAVAWVVLHERPSRSTVLAVPVVLVGVALIAGVTGGGYGSSPVLGGVLGLGTACAYSGFLLLLRAAGTGRRGPAEPLALATLSAVVGIGAVGAALGELDPVPSWPAHGWLLALALGSQVVAWLLITTALPRLPALTTSVLLLLQPVGSVALGVLVLAERPSPAQLAGVGLVLVGVAVAQRRGAVPAPTAARQESGAGGRGSLP